MRRWKAHNDDENDNDDDDDHDGDDDDDDDDEELSDPMFSVDGPLVTSQPRSITVREGHSAQLHCGGEGNPAPRYTWYR